MRGFRQKGHGYQSLTCNDVSKTIPDETDYRERLAISLLHAMMISKTIPDETDYRECLGTPLELRSQKI